MDAAGMVLLDRYVPFVDEGCRAAHALPSDYVLAELLYAFTDDCADYRLPTAKANLWTWCSSGPFAQPVFGFIPLLKGCSMKPPYPQHGLRQVPEVCRSMCYGNDVVISIVEDDVVYLYLADLKFMDARNTEQYIVIINVRRREVSSISKFPQESRPIPRFLPGNFSSYFNKRTQWNELLREKCGNELREKWEK
ncbi:hypothetical protein E2562_022455 [Oryza meyeriana var. granulata]|uniref:DUF1618 domain-containing protein n=1 Tax=Oryza meyeriana var. granulata TaxID=110450 RepID=A0A6G1BMT6_9ORYZ|nr:hypothetical protein E2562_022455 [Oryza meyeriana var. granulata]